MNRVPPIDAVEHIGQLRGRDSNNAVGRRRPDETALLQPFGVERHAEAVVPKNFDQIASGAAKDVEVAGVRIAMQSFLDLQSQTIHAAPHIGAADSEPHAYTRGDRDHRRSNTSRTRRSAGSSNLRPTRMRYLPETSISMVSGIADAGSATSRSAVTTTGISCGADALDA